MPMIQRKSKLNDFLIGSVSSRLKPNPNAAVRTCLVRTSSNIGTYLSTRTGKDVCGYHAEKVRPKFKTTKVLFKSGPYKGQVKSSTVEKIREGGWKLRVFSFPSNRVKSFTQFDRHFVIELKY